MDAKYLEVTLSNDLEWSKHIATMTNKTNSTFSFWRRNLKGCPEKLKQTVERVQRRAAKFVKSRYSRYSSVSDMLDVLGWTPLSQRRQEARLILFYKIIYGLAQVPFEGVFVEAHKGTRRKHSMKLRQIGHTTSQYGQLFFPKTAEYWIRIRNHSYIPVFNSRNAIKFFNRCSQYLNCHEIV